MTEGIDLTGKVAVVTGCTNGIGFETMRVLARRGAHVVGTGRTREKAALACGRVEGRTTPVVLELSDLRSVVACADQVHELTNTVDMLVCNAGVVGAGRLELVGGVERTFATNHLGHFVLVNRLLARVTATPAGRVVMVSSDVAYRSARHGIDFDSLHGRGRYTYMRAYAQSKLANALFSRELARRLRGTRAVSNALHPGFVRSNIENNSPTALKWMFKLAGPLVAKTVAQGAATTCYVAAHPDIEGVSGEFFQDCAPVTVKGRHHLEDDAMAARLWEVSLDLTRAVNA